MKTLIELYDERAVENVLAPEVFRPERIVYLCPEEIAQNPQAMRTLGSFFASRGYDPQIECSECSLFKADRIYRQLCRLAQRYGDCAIDVTGGTDAALFAAGMFCRETGTPAFTFSRKMNRFYDISGAPFADNLPCTVRYSVEECFLMAGGCMRPGRVDNALLGRYMAYYEPFFRVFLDHRRGWAGAVSFFQRISQRREDETLHAEGSFTQKGEHGRTVSADPALLEDLQRIGFLRDLVIEGQEYVSFTFRDGQVRTWLRDVGSVLELYMYKACVDSGIFDDIVSSAVVDWNAAPGPDAVSNEIDVMATRGIIPLFISCKATEVRTEALNELAILRDRFGGKMAKAVIVTTDAVHAATRHRAAQLGIAVIDMEELRAGRTAGRLQVIMKTRETLEPAAKEK